VITVGSNYTPAPLRRAQTTSTPMPIDAGSAENHAALAPAQEPLVDLFRSPLPHHLSLSS
jgi:hypothetical protein